MNPAYENGDPSMPASGLDPKGTPQLPGTNPRGINKADCGKRD